MTWTWTIPIRKTLTGFFQDFRGNLSWGRFCSAVSLGVGIIQEFRHADLTHIGLFMGIATGTYSVSKVTEMFCGRGPQPPQDGGQA